MCLLALFFRVVEDAPVVVGANREEAYARGGEPPQLLDGPIAAVGGRDPVAGGTWLGVNARGVLVAATNRPRSQVPPQPPSRGLLVRELLGCPTAAAAADLAGRELSTNRYAGCNILCVDAERAVVFLAGDWLRMRHLPPGIHVLTASDVNDVNDCRIAHARRWLHRQRYGASGECLEALRQLCGQTGEPPMCLHGERGGTVSSSLIALQPRLSESVYLHAHGPPDRTPYADYSPLLKQLAAVETRGA
jgi:uncharacterized protein with NRDE domain